MIATAAFLGGASAFMRNLGVAKSMRPIFLGFSLFTQHRPPTKQPFGRVGKAGHLTV